MRLYGVLSGEIVSHPRERVTADGTPLCWVWVRYMRPSREKEDYESHHQTVMVCSNEAVGNYMKEYATPGARLIAEGRLSMYTFRRGTPESKAVLRLWADEIYIMWSRRNRKTTDAMEHRLNMAAARKDLER